MDITSRNLKKIKIEITQNCPLGCLHCSTSAGRNRNDHIPIDILKRLLNEASEMGVESVSFSGGEPLVYPELNDLVSYSSGLGLYLSLYTSGIINTNLHPLSVDGAKALVESGVDRFIFSIYSTNQSGHSSITGFDTLPLTLEAMKNTTAARAKCVEIHFVALKRNYRDLENVVSLASSLGVSQVSILRFVPQGRGAPIARTEKLSRNQLIELANAINTIKHKYGDVNIRVGAPYNILGLGKSQCNAGESILVITYSGQAVPCDGFKNVNYPDKEHGNIYNTSLQSIWERSGLLNRVRYELGNDLHKTKCGECNLLSSCQSGCLAQKVVQNGWNELDLQDPDCLIITNEEEPDNIPLSFKVDSGNTSQVGFNCA